MLAKLCRVLLLTVVSFLSSPSVHAQREVIDLSGEWRSSLGVCSLPGTTDENRLGGERVQSGPTSGLTRLFPYSGKVTYEREVNVTQSMVGKRLTISLERTKPSTLWIDGDSVGSVCQLYAPHVYELPALKAGMHTIKLLIDNSDDVVPASVRGSHAWSESTQTNWNGVLGKMMLEATPKTYIADMQVFPDVEMCEVLVRFKIVADKGGNAVVSARRDSYCEETDDECFVSKNVTLHSGENDVELSIDMGENPRLWSEFHPDLYTVTATLQSGKSYDERKCRFGVRKFVAEGTQFVINGNPTFLRGTHDACVFPLTGYAPTDVEQWRRLFTIAKQYGINHYRFHSYTPTEAAFAAADEVGIYLHTELPLWGTIDSTTVSQNDFLRHEAFTTLQWVGNHPSFVGMGLGNELWGDVDMMRQWLDEFRTVDNRHLYYMGANNDLGWKGPKEGEDFYVTCRVGGGEGFSTHARTSFSFADADNGGILNSQRPNTSRDFSNAVSLCPRPIVSHETCQFQIYPDYTELPKYTGVLYPYNLETFRDRLKENGLTSQIADFHRATGLWAIECCKADIETCMSTEGFGGFQMLDIKDYPGQGTALVGILDAFMDSKGLTSPETFRQWNAPVVPMFKTATHCYTTADTLRGTIVMANYSEDDYRQPLTWTIQSDKWQQSGEVDFYDAWQGMVSKIGVIEIPLHDIDCSTQLHLTLSTGEYSNTYNFWVYKQMDEAVLKKDMSKSKVMEAHTLNDEVLKALRKGRTVLLTPSLADIEQQSVGGLFTPDYWNYAMFKTISENNQKQVSPGTLGMLMDSQHPLFNSFPTEGYSDWQWWSIALHSRPLILNSLPHDYLPVIQTVDNIERNHKLGILMEARIGKGRLLISTTDFDAISQYPEGKAYANAVRQYAASRAFQPTYELSISQIQRLLNTATETRNIQGVKNITDYKQK